jgi:hypothetical protein
MTTTRTLPVAFRRFRRLRYLLALHGFDEPVRLYEVRWREA